MNFASDAKKWHIFYFTESGRILSEAIWAHVKQGARYTKNSDLPLSRTIEQAFEQHRISNSEVLVFIGATGIAVRSIAPFIKDKFTDPPVIVIDDMGHHVISLLSGHAGGANAATHWLVQRLNASGYTAVPVITTATEKRGLKGIEALLQKYKVPLIHERMAIKAINMHLANGGAIQVSVDPLLGAYEQNLQRHLNQTSIHIAICLRTPESWCKDTHFDYVFTSKSLVVGTGSKRDLDCDAYLQALNEALEEKGFMMQAIAHLSSVALKSDEPCLLHASRVLEAPLSCHAVEALKRYEDLYTGSAFVLEHVGISAVAGPSAQILTDDVLAREVIKKKGCTFAFGRLIK